MNILDEAQIKDTAEQLNKLAERINQINFNKIIKHDEISISFDEINKAKAGEIRNQLSYWGEGFYIYVIQATGETNIDGCRQQYEKEKKENAKKDKEKRRAYARLNKNNTDSRVFYVGSSSSLGSRIEQHLGFGPSGTFALQAWHWSQGLSGGLNISIWSFPDNIEQDVIQAIEDGIWEKCKPMFGRRGPK